MSEYLFSDITQIIIGCAMKVHRTIGRGFPENIYQKSLEIELNKTQLSFETEKSHSVFYEDILVGKRRVDFIVDEKIIVEIKAVGNYEPSQANQIINYLSAFNIPVGLLINFGKPSLEFKRFVNNNHPLIKK